MFVFSLFLCWHGNKQLPRWMVSLIFVSSGWLIETRNPTFYLTPARTFHWKHSFVSMGATSPTLHEGGNLPQTSLGGNIAPYIRGVATCPMLPLTSAFLGMDNWTCGLISWLSLLHECFNFHVAVQAFVCEAAFKWSSFWRDTEMQLIQLATNSSERNKGLSSNENELMEELYLNLLLLQWSVMMCAICWW